MALSPEQMRSAIAAAASADLLFLLEEAQVDLPTQHQVVITGGYTNITLLSGPEEDRAGI